MYVCVCWQVEHSFTASAALVSALQAKITALTLENQQLAGKLKVCNPFIQARNFNHEAINKQSQTDLNSQRTLFPILHSTKIKDNTNIINTSTEIKI